MITLRLLSSILLLVTITSCQERIEKDYEGYSELEIETENCLDQWLESKDVVWEELQEIFEGYFADGSISNSSDSKLKQYRDILNHWEKPSQPFPAFKNKARVLAIKEKLGLSDQNILMKSQLDCFTNNYIDNKSIVDTASSYYALGSVLEAVREMPNISPGIIASVINSSTENADLEKELYQKTIILMYCFDMSLFLSDGSD